MYKDMRFKCKEPNEWKKVFAFFPKKITGYWVWLEFFEATKWEYDGHYDLSRRVRLITS